MTHTEHTTQSRKGKHLSFDERQFIAYLKNKLGLSNRAIAKELGRAPQTIHNEIKDGTVDVIKQRQIHGTKQYDYRKTEYSPEVGQAAYDTARLNSGRTYLWVESTDFIAYADDQILRLHQSPDSVVGTAKVANLFPEKRIPCTKTLYNWIDKGFMETQNIDLVLKVRRKTKSTKIRKNKTFLGNSIDFRPDCVTARETFGHWEIDTVVGLKSGQDQVLLTLTERKTRFEIIQKIEGKNALAVQSGIENLQEQFGHF
ncbi:IS30 family transposase, partial [Enterococcus italicus]